jgi:hypothetical protein
MLNVTIYIYMDPMDHEQVVSKPGDRMVGPPSINTVAAARADSHSPGPACERTMPRLLQSPKFSDFSNGNLDHFAGRNGMIW